MPDHFHLIVNPRDGRIRQWTGALKSLSAKRLVEIAPESFSQRQDRRRHPAPGLAREFQGPTTLERLDDLAKDQLHSRQPAAGRIGQFSQRLSLVQLWVLLSGRCRSAPADR